jgi:hypothetical protein
MYNMYLVVCIGAPLGSVLGSYVHRLVLAWCVYITCAVQLVAATVLVLPWERHHARGLHRPVHLTATSCAIFVGGLVFFFYLQKIGSLLMERNAIITAKISSSPSESIPTGDLDGTDEDTNELGSLRSATIINLYDDGRHESVEMRAPDWSGEFGDLFDVTTPPVVRRSEEEDSEGGLENEQPLRSIIGNMVFGVIDENESDGYSSSSSANSSYQNSVKSWSE